jgi:2,5-diketo-D-gluconate reductase B
MEFINISATTKMPALGLGTWLLRGKECADGVARAIDMGYRHIDTAQIYENEAEVGAGIRASLINRDELFITTKIWMDRVGNGALQKSLDESLDKLGTGHVDLLLIHWPVTDVPFMEQCQALADVQVHGKTRHIGVSNFNVAQLKEIVETIGAPIVTNQVEYHPYLSQKPVLDYLRAHDMFLTAYSPIARGKVGDDPVLIALARKHGKTPAQITLRWLIQQGDVAAIPKAASPDHLKANLDIFDFTLEESEMAQIHALARLDGRMIKPDWSPVWDKAA